MLTISYYLLFIIWSFLFLIIQILSSFLAQGQKKESFLIKKSFFELSLFKQIYLIYFYDLNLDSSCYKHLLNNYEVILLLRQSNNLVITWLNFLNIRNNKTATSFNSIRQLYKKLSITKLSKTFLRNLFFIFSLEHKSNFFSFYILNKILIMYNFTTYLTSFMSNLYLRVFLNLNNGFCRSSVELSHSLSNLNRIKVLKSFDVYLYEQKNIFGKKIKVLPNSTSFEKISNFLKRITRINDTSYWRWSLTDSLNNTIYNVNNQFQSTLANQWPVRYSPTTVSKFITENILESSKIYFLRKNKIFNKSRYSRNRQLYRTGVYWCLWLSIFLGWGLYFILYRFTLNFGHLWWLVYLGLSLFFFVKAFKYRFYNLKLLVLEIENIIIWCYLLINQSLSTLLNLFKFIQVLLNNRDFRINNFVGFNKVTFFDRFFSYWYSI